MMSSSPLATTAPTTGLPGKLPTATRMASAMLRLLVPRPVTRRMLADDEEVLAVHEALDSLAEAHAQAAELVKLRYFAGFEMNECAEMLGISESTAHRLWKFAKAWLFQKLSVT